MTREFYPKWTTDKIMQDHRRGIDRAALFATRTHEVDENEYQALIAGFSHIIKETQRSVRVVDFGNYHSGDGPYGSPDWYQQQAMTNRDTGLGPQVNAGWLDDLLRSEPFQRQNPHYDLMVIDRDLQRRNAGPNDNFIFGYGPYPNNIISTRRFRAWITDPRLRRLSLAVLGAHEFGHNLGLLLRNFNTGTEGLSAGHCNGEAGPCLMEQVNVGGKTIVDQAQILPDRERWLCADCTDHIQAIREHLRGVGVIW